MTDRPDFSSNPNLIEIAAELLDPPMWLAMALIKDTAANQPKTQGEAIDRIVALCKHAVHMACKVPPEPLTWRVVHVRSGKTVAAFLHADVAKRYMEDGAKCGGWNFNEVRLEQGVKA